MTTPLRRAFGRTLFIAPALLLAAAPAQAQAPTTTTFSPARNAIAAPWYQPVALTFSQPLDPATGGNAGVFSAVSGGRKAATATVTGAVLSVQPTRGFRPGEVVSVTVPGTVTSATGTPVAPAVYQFTAAAGAGPATFATGTDVTVGGSSAALLLDVDNDGDLDLVAPGATRSVSLNDGRGNFSPTTSPMLGFGSILSGADLDNDGDEDLVSSYLSSQTSGTVQTFRNNGSGTFTATQTLSGIIGAPTDFATGDVDADGDLDILVSGAFLAFPGSGAPPATSAVLFLNRGNGSFQNGVVLQTGGAGEVLLADLDSDGDLDMLLGNGTARVFFNNGTGQFTGGPTLVGGSLLTPADVDGDGDLDVVSLSTSAGLVYVNRNSGNGTFGAAASVLVGFGPVQLAVADLDGDGDLDLVTGNDNAGVYSASIRLNNGSGGFGGGSDPALPSRPGSLVTGDVDGDGDLDWVTGTGNTGTVRVQLNGNTGTALATVPAAAAAALLFPNPAHGSTTVQLGAGATKSPLTLLDALGREVRHYPAPAGTAATLDLRGLPAGVYWLRDGAGGQRLVVE